MVSRIKIDERVEHTLRRFAAKHDQVLAKERLHTRQAQMCEARAAVEQRVDAAQREVRAIAKMHAFEDTRRHRATMADLFRLRKCHYAAVCDVPALDQAYSLQFR